MEGEPYAYLLIQNIILDITTYLILLVIVILIICSALLSGSEVAFFSLGPKDLADIKAEGTNSNQRILRLVANHKYLLATILIANNFINIGIVILSSFLFKEKFRLEENFSYWGNFFISTIVVVFLLVLFGEVAPKVYAKAKNRALARLMSSPLLLLQKVFFPLSYLLVNGSIFLEKRLKKHAEDLNTFSNEEFDQAIELAVQNSEHGQREVDLLKRIVKFGDLQVTQIMCSRVDVIRVDYEYNFQQILDTFVASSFSRIPVYSHSIDEIKGILHSKDLLIHLNASKDFNWHTLIRPALFIPESRKIDDLFRDFKHKRMHMAIVVDEYGGTSGIATLEDVLEEIVGEIKDEFDIEDDIEYTQIDPYNFLFDGKVLINDICRVLKVSTHFFDEIKGEAESLGGLLREITLGIPEASTILRYKNIVFTVKTASLRRIEKVKITLPNEYNN